MAKLCNHCGTYVEPVAYEAESALCNVNKHHLQLNTRDGVNLRVSSPHRFKAVAQCGQLRNQLKFITSDQSVKSNKL
jgi:hypothetical protein